MSSQDVGQITLLLRDISSGNEQAESRLLDLVYPELRRLAAHYMVAERGDHTLQPTALVHEAYLRMVGDSGLSSQNRAHFFAIAAILMRQILLDYARKHRASKRGGGVQRTNLSTVLGNLVAAPAINCDVMIAVDGALNKLEQIDRRQARIVEMRFFGGLTEEEIADVLKISARSVTRDWRMAKAWLNGYLDGKTPPADA